MAGGYLSTDPNAGAAAPDDSAFKAWYGGHAKKQGLDPNPDAPEHFYDYRAAFKAGATPDQTGHWPSQFKTAGHPRTYLDSSGNASATPKAGFSDTRGPKYLSTDPSAGAPRGTSGGDSGAPKPPPDAGAPNIFRDLYGAGEAALNMGSGMLAKPISDIAGLAATGREMVSPSGGSPTDFKQDVQRRMTFEPQTERGKQIAEYNPIALIGKAFGYGGEKAGEAIRGDAASDTFRGAAGNAVQEAIPQLPALAGVKGGKMAKESIPGKQAELDRQKSLNAPLDQIRAQSQEAGLTTPPEGTSWLSSIPGMARINRSLSALNQPQVNELMAQQLKLPKETALTPDVMKQVRADAGQAYQRIVDSAYGSVLSQEIGPVGNTLTYWKDGRLISDTTPQKAGTRVPGLQLGGEFKSSLDGTLKTLERQITESPETFKSLKPSASLLREWAKKAEINPREAMEAIKTLRSDATTNFRSAKPKDRQAGFTRMEIANRLEDAFEANLAKVEKPELLQQFRDARKQIAQSYDIEKALDAAGNVDARKLALLAKRRPLSENLKLVADFAETYSKAAKKPVEGVQGASVLDWMSAMYAAAAGHGALGVGAAAARAGVNEAAKRGMLQRPPPSYEVGRTRKALPYALPAAGIGAQAGQLERPPE